RVKSKSCDITKPHRGAISQPRVSALGKEYYPHLDFGGIVAFFFCNNADKIFSDLVILVFVSGI
ncbi:hypothetical protein, partial [Cyclobacterium amurskyense]|uniref:hypothetical protein n=1 Tax=Cyclobacterium amurskyense TaxID=320787 RepID=UPI0030DAEEAC